MIPEGVLIATCKAMHARDVIGKAKSGRRKKYSKVKWDPENPELVHHYAEKAEPVLLALMEAGYVPLPTAEVAKAYRPRIEMSPVHPIIRLSGR